MTTSLKRKDIGMCVSTVCHIHDRISKIFQKLFLDPEKTDNMCFIEIISRRRRKINLKLCYKNGINGKAISDLYDRKSIKISKFHLDQELLTVEIF